MANKLTLYFSGTQPVNTQPLVLSLSHLTQHVNTQPLVLSLSHLTQPVNTQPLVLSLSHLTQHVKTQPLVLSLSHLTQHVNTQPLVLSLSHLTQHVNTQCVNTECVVPNSQRGDEFKIQKYYMQLRVAATMQHQDSYSETVSVCAVIFSSRCSNNKLKLTFCATGLSANSLTLSRV